MPVAIGSFPQYKATDNISPARVIVRSATVARECVQATSAALKPIGISANHNKYAKGGFEDTAYPYLAIAGDYVDYVGPGNECYATSGAAISNMTLPLISDSTGRVISATLPPAFGASTLIWSVGSPLEVATAANQLIKIQVEVSQFLGSDAANS